MSERGTHTVPMDEFVRAYEEMAAEVERVAAEYPEEMRDALRAHAQDVLRERLQDLWDERQRRRAQLC